MTSRYFILLVLVAALCRLPVSADVVDQQEPQQRVSENAIEFKEDSRITTSMYGRVVWVLVLGTGIALLAVLTLRYKLVKFNGLARLGAGRIALIEAKRLAPRLTAVLTKVDDVEYLIITGEGGSTVVKHGSSKAKGGDDA